MILSLCRNSSAFTTIYGYLTCLYPICSHSRTEYIFYMILVVLMKFSLKIRYDVRASVIESTMIIATVKYLTNYTVVMLSRKWQKMPTRAKRTTQTTRQTILHKDSWHFFCCWQLNVLNLQILKKIYSLHIQQQARLLLLFRSCRQTHNFIHFWCTKPTEPLHSHGTISQLSSKEPASIECPSSQPSKQILQMISCSGLVAYFLLSGCWLLLLLLMR